MPLPNKLNGWCRAALVFSVTWSAVVLALLLYERYVTLGDATSKYAVLRAAVGDYHALLFYATYTHDADFHFYLRTQRFWTVLLLPMILAGAIAALGPTLAWVRAGFSGSTPTSAGDSPKPADPLNPEAYRLVELMKQLAPDRTVSPDEHAIVSVYQTRYMAKLMVVLAEEQEKASVKMEHLTSRLVTQTDTLIKFTRGLYWLTAALLILGTIQFFLAFRCH